MWYLTNRLWEFHDIYNLGAVGDKDELIRSWGQKDKGQGHDKTLTFSILTILSFHTCKHLKISETVVNYKIKNSK